MTDTAKQATPETVCEWCGPKCYRGAEHNARVEDNARYTDDVFPAVLAQPAPTPICRHCKTGRAIHKLHGRYVHTDTGLDCCSQSIDNQTVAAPIPPTSAPGGEGGFDALRKLLLRDYGAGEAAYHLGFLVGVERQITDLKRQLTEAERKGLLRAANLVATMAERPYEDEPCFSAMVDAESRIRALAKESK